MRPHPGWDEGFEEASRRAAASTLEVARRRGLVDIGYTTVDTPVGTLFVASTGRGLVRLAFPEEPFEHVLEELTDTLSPRVLEDPKQRYLLADEVGLGKTIEAGLIIRQHLLDHPQGHVVVITPPLASDEGCCRGPRRRYCHRCGLCLKH